MSLKVSVIIPTHNRANLLKKAIESVFKQTYKNFEVIVVDDGSTDNTKEICSKLSFEHLRCVCQENSGGAAKPKNRGIKMAQGEYIAILDDDDEWLPEKLEKQVKFLENHPEIDIVGCNYLINGTKEYKIPEYKNVLKRILATDDMGPGSIMMYRRKVFDKPARNASRHSDAGGVGGFDENLRSGQDKEMRIRLADKGYKFDFVREPLVIYRTGHNNISSSFLDISEREKDWNYLYNKYKKYYDQDPQLYRDKLRYDGTRYMLLGDSKKARKCFLKSKNYSFFLISFFGKSFYKALTKIKLWLNW